VQPRIAAAKPGQISLVELCREIESVRQRLDPRKQQHSTAGFFGMLVSIAVRNLLQEGEQEQDSDEILKWEGDVGGYRDVGLHHNLVPLSTCWPLVEQVFHYLADQVR
jgi:hypothetical protein